MKKTAIFMCLVLICAGFFAIGAANSKKPVKPPDPTSSGPTGTIYFTMLDDNDVKWVYSVGAGGPYKPAKDHQYLEGMDTMSHSKHGGYWWYVGFKIIPDESNYDGQQRKEVFATREDGSVCIQLTDDRTLTYDNYSCRPVWGPDDEFISWSGLRWSMDENNEYVISHGGLYKSDIYFDEDGDVTDIGSISLVESCGTWTSTSSGKELTMPDIREIHSWHPDGTNVVYLKCMV